MNPLLWRAVGRRLVARPARTAGILLLLGLPLGLTITTFRLVESVVLSPFPFPGADRLVAPTLVSPRRDTVGFAGPDARLLHAELQSFSALAEFDGQAQVVQAGLHTDRVDGAEVSASLPTTLGVAPLAGRFFNESEDLLDGPNVVVLGANLARLGFGAVDRAVGQRVRLGGVDYLVVGVMPSWFRFPVGAQYWIPLWRDASLEHRDNFDVSVVARLRDGVTPSAGAIEVGLFGARIANAFPDRIGFTASSPSLAARLIPRALTQTALGLQAAAIATWFLALSVLAGLFAAETLRRAGETATRAALGASRRQLVAEFASDALAHAGLAAALGLMISAAIHRLGPQALPSALGGWLSGTESATTVVASVLAAVLSGLTVGVLPATWLIARAGTSPGRLLRAGTTIGPRGAHGQGGVLVFAAGAATLLVLVGGAVIEQLLRLQRVDLGFRPEGTAFASYSLQGDRFADRTVRIATALTARELVQSIPGVTQAAGATRLPGLGAPMTAAVRAVLGDSAEAHYVAATPGLFATLGIAVEAGRDFQADDLIAASPRIAIVSRGLATRLWPGQDPLGQEIQIGAPGQPTGVAPGAPKHLVVGVVADVRDGGPEVEAARSVYLPISAFPALYLHLVARGSVGPGAVAAALRPLGADAPVFRSTRLIDALGELAWRPRAITAGMVVLATLGLMIALTGVWATVRVHAIQHEREYALRAAVGASPTQLLWHLLQTPVGLVAAGVGVGLLASWPARWVWATALDTRTPQHGFVAFGLAAAVLFCAVVAAWYPARRILRVDAMSVLRRNG